MANVKEFMQNLEDLSAETLTPVDTTSTAQDGAPADGGYTRSSDVASQSKLNR